MQVAEGTLLWTPDNDVEKETVMTDYINWVNEKYQLSLDNYDDLWHWSVTSIEAFWESVWDYFKVKTSTDYQTVLEERKMPGAKWFKGASLNYAEHILRNHQVGKTAIYSQSERRPFSEMSWDELSDKTASVVQWLKEKGVVAGDRVVGYMPNVPETIIAFLATASIGAIWSSCPPEFGVGSTLSRFQQIEPKVLFTVDGYQYNGKSYDKKSSVKELVEKLPSLQETVILPYLKSDPDISFLNHATRWEELLNKKEPLTFEQVPFDHPLWILYSSGTTGLPKAIVQGHGGILLQQLMQSGIQGNLTEEDRFFWYTTTGWMMWNSVVGSLLTGASIILYDGNPAYPDLSVLWRLVEKSAMTTFGTSPPYVLSCMKAGLEPGEQFDLSSLKSFAYTGSPLSPEGFQWVYDHVKKDIRLAPGSGGTDLCGGIVGSAPTLPVHAAEIPCRNLGVSVYSYNEEGKPVYDEVGEMVITEPMPSMPLFFWNDPDFERYQKSYFDMFPGVWRHGDLLKITGRGSAVIYGRSDATINRMGVRSGSSEIYNAVEALPEILDSLVVDLSGYYHRPYMPLFVVLREGIELDNALISKINQNIRQDVSPRHIPDDILVIKEVPRTLTGKKMEIPIRKILLGTEVKKAVSVDAMANPNSIEYFIKLAKKIELEKDPS